MTKDLENLINLIFMSSASSILLSGNSISQPEKIALHVAQSFLCKDIKKNNLLCNDCHSCNLFSANSHPDIKVIERSKDKTQIQIKQIRNASDFIYSTPLIADKKIVLILRADELNFFAQDTLLKSLEEPPCKDIKKNNLFCNDCHSCNLFSANSHPDIKVIERSKDRTQIQIKQIRDASDFIYSTPLIADKKIVLILRADELNFFAQDTLLKSLEEPPENLKFILTTSLPYRLKPTVLSRLTHYKLNPEIHSLNSESNNDGFIDINKNDYPEECWNKDEKVMRLFDDLASLKGRKIINYLIKDKDKDNLLIKLNWLSKIIEESILIHFTETLSDTPFTQLSKEIKNTLDADTLIYLYDEILPLINSLQSNENLNYDFQTAAISY